VTEKTVREIHSIEVIRFRATEVRLYIIQKRARQQQPVNKHVIQSITTIQNSKFMNSIA
jgi:hypothetical protein